MSKKEKVWRRQPDGAYCGRIAGVEFCLFKIGRSAWGVRFRDGDRWVTLHERCWSLGKAKQAARDRAEAEWTYFIHPDGYPSRPFVTFVRDSSVVTGPRDSAEVKWDAAGLVRELAGGVPANCRRRHSAGLAAAMLVARDQIVEEGLCRG